MNKKLFVILILSVFLINLGSCADWNPFNITTSADGAHSVFGIDVDGDGDIDAMSASYFDDTIAWYENDGSESFTKHDITTSADGAYSVFGIDVDGDGDIDAMSASYNDDTIAWYENSKNIDLLNPINNINIITDYINFTAQIKLTGLINNTNQTIYIWNENNTLFSTNTKYLTGNETIYPSWYLNSFVLDNSYKWNVKACSNDGLCYWASDNSTFNKVLFLENSRTVNSISYQTQSETFNINLSLYDSLAKVSLLYNEIEYPTTKSGTVYSTTLDIPKDSLGNKSVRWKIVYDGNTYYSDYSYQNVLETVFTICNTTYTDNFMNVSFKDEASLLFINASIPTSTFNYYLGSGTETKTYSYYNTVDNYNYEFCATPNLEFNIDSYIQYKQGTEYPQRIHDVSNKKYTSSVTNDILYLLNSVDGIYTTFQVLNAAEQGIQGVSVVGTREIESETVTVANGVTDSAGSVTFWVNPDFVHTFNFSKAGYGDLIYESAPTQTSYTVTLSGEDVPDSDCIRGISYVISPSSNFLDENTEYDFELTLDSSYWNVDNFSASMYYQNGTLISTDTRTTQGGTIIFENINTNTDDSISMDYSFSTNGILCLDSSNVWYIQSTAGRQFSIFRIFTDASMYMDANMFGIKGDSGTDNFGRALISFFIIVAVTGVTINRYGIQSETAILGIITGLVIMLDFGLGLIPPLEIGSIQVMDNFISMIAFLAFIVFIIKGERG